MPVIGRSPGSIAQARENSAQLREYNNMQIGESVQSVACGSRFKYVTSPLNPDIDGYQESGLYWTTGAPSTDTIWN
jgi:hypothetical protein